MEPHFVNYICVYSSLEFADDFPLEDTNADMVKNADQISGAKTHTLTINSPR